MTCQPSQMGRVFGVCNRAMMMVVMIKMKMMIVVIVVLVVGFTLPSSSIER